MDNFKQIYLKYVEDNNFSSDPSQLQLARLLSSYKTEIENRNNFITKFQSWLTPSIKKKGIYVWGDVGRGKSMIMNLFFNSINLKAKQRIHFHYFMNNVHAQLDIMRKSKIIEDDYVKSFAHKLSKNYKVLYLDELQINNIADAMIVGRLFTYLAQFNVFILFTSNRVPFELFKDGLQRERFVPFIEFINDKFEVFNLDNALDYRLQKLDKKVLYFYPLTSENRNKVNDIIYQLTGHKELNTEEVEVYENRKLTVRECYGYLGVFTFEELCGEAALGAVDYIALCKRFNFFIIKDIPKLEGDQHNEALRFITLIDCLYETKTKLLCLAEMKPEEIYKGSKNKFEFQRTVSRLYEMQTETFFNSMSSLLKRGLS